MLINLTNREHTGWSKDQTAAAENYGKIVDFPMPGVPAEASEEETDRMADLILRRVLRRLEEQNPDEAKEPGSDMVICQGDFTLVYRLVSRLKAEGIAVAAPTFRRVRKPTLRPDGTTVPGYDFQFVRFRQY